MDFRLGLEGSNGMGSHSPASPRSLPYVEERNFSIFFGDSVLFSLERRWRSKKRTFEVTVGDLPKRTHKAKNKKKGPR